MTSIFNTTLLKFFLASGFIISLFSGAEFAAAETVNVSVSPATLFVNQPGTVSWSMSGTLPQYQGLLINNYYCRDPRGDYHDGSSGSIAVTNSGPGVTNYTVSCFRQTTDTSVVCADLYCNITEIFVSADSQSITYQFPPGPALACQTTPSPVGTVLDMCYGFANQASCSNFYLYDAILADGTYEYWQNENSSGLCEGNNICTRNVRYTGIVTGELCVDQPLVVSAAPASCGSGSIIYSWPASFAEGIQYEVSFTSGSTYVNVGLAQTVTWSGQPAGSSRTLFARTRQGATVGPAGSASAVVPSACYIPPVPPATCNLGAEIAIESGPTNMFAGSPPCANVDDLAPYTSPSCPVGATTGTTVNLGQLSAGGYCATRQTQQGQCLGIAYVRACSGAPIPPSVQLNFQ